LIKEATAVKKTDLKLAISKIDEALNLCPTEKNYSWWFKKANYLYLAKKRDEAFSIYRKLLVELNPHEIKFYHSDTSSILREMAKQLYKEENYLEYLHHELAAWWHDRIHQSLLGQYNAEFLDSLNVLEGRKHKKAIEEADVPELKEKLIAQFLKLIDSKKDYLQLISREVEMLPRRSCDALPVENLEFKEAYDALALSFETEFVPSMQAQLVQGD
ncbi:MAG: hypothetical protein KDD53_12285, partial [Bdellovibrionales bacterium]|nr:hypothetical protein [Bdellovibrionales bacterium]